MTEYRNGPHSVFAIHLHLVWVTKFRKGILQGNVAVRVRDIIREICGAHDVVILSGHVSKDHLHLHVSIPPQITISRLVQILKGRTAYKLLQENANLRRQYWGRHMWAIGYFCATSGQITDEIVRQYIENQDKEGDTKFKIEGE